MKRRSLLCHLWSTLSCLLWLPSRRYLTCRRSQGRRSVMPPTTALCIALSLSSCLLLSGALWSRTAYAEDFNPAESVYDTIVGNSVGWGQQRWLVAVDLAWRYYQAEPSLRDVQPLVPAYPNVGRLSDYSNYEEWRVNAIANGFMVTFPYNFNDLDGNGEWDVNTPNHEIEYEKWYNYYQGITAGGGSESGEFTNPMVLTGQFGYYRYGYTNSDSVEGKTCTVSITTPAGIDLINSKLQEGYEVHFLFYGYSGNERKLNIIFSNEQYPLTVTYSNVGTDSRVSYNVDISQTYIYSCDVGNFVNNAGNVTIDCTRINSGYLTSASRTGVWYQYLSGSQSGGGGNQPTEPVYPTPYQPTTPEPPTSPPDNNPTNVNIGGNTYNNNTSTTTADLTPLLEMLRIINSNIIEFETGFNNYANKVQEYLSNIYDMVYGFLENIQDEIDDYGRLILEELREANQWLAYIFYSLGQGGGSQPDPVVKPDDWWGWLGNLADGLLGDLPTELTALTGTMQALRSVFPFSLPWDLGVLLGLFVATPVTPVLDIPFGYSANGITYIHVDFSAWNNVMSTVRSVELVAFAAGLAFKTRDLLKVVEV